MVIKFRPHHFLCALNFQGRGYSPAFIENFSAIMKILTAENTDDVVIEVTQHTDSICLPCPHRLDKMCTSQEKISALDRAHEEALNIKVNDKLTWEEAKNRIAKNVSLEVFHKICARCSWKEQGICETSLSQFIQNKLTT